MNIPAFCDNPNCGGVFSSGIVVTNGSNITLVGNKSGPCPRCGSMGHIPDGVFNFLGDTIEILSAPKTTIEELSSLSKILKEAYEQKLSSEQVAKRIEQDVPNLSKLNRFFKEQSGWINFLQLLMTAATLIYAIKSSNANNTTIDNNITINQVIEQTYADCQN